MKVNYRLFRNLPELWRILNTIVLWFKNKLEHANPCIYQSKHWQDNTKFCNTKNKNHNTDKTLMSGTRQRGFVWLFVNTTTLKIKKYVIIKVAIN